MSYMPNIGTQVELKDGRVAWVSQITPDGSDDRVVFDDGREERIDQLEGIQRIIGEEAAYGFDYPEAQRMLNGNERYYRPKVAKLTLLRQQLEKEHNEQFNTDTPTEFEKWWHSYTKGRVDTRDENIAQDSWQAAEDYLLTRIEAILKDQ